MKRSYIKFDDVVTLLKSGHEIFTDRGFGGAPYNPLFYRLYKGDSVIGELHPSTIKKLIKDNIIYGTNSKSKYSLINHD